MGARILDGKALSKQVRAELADRVAALKAQGVTPGLAVILAGDDPASAVYVRHKERAAAALGVEAFTVRMGDDADAAAVQAEIDRLNADPAVHGILVQLPLPAGVSADETSALLTSVDPDKDVDGFHPVNLGRLVAGLDGFVACTPSGCMRLIAEAGVDPAGKRAVVIGRSVIVGKPMALLLLQANATVTICHSRTADLAARVREADIVVAAVGRERLVKADWIKPGAVVIDVGMNRDAAGKLCGDVDTASVAEVAGAITPVPGGVGPMTIAGLMTNVVRAAERRISNAAGLR